MATHSYLPCIAHDHLNVHKEHLYNTIKLLACDQAVLISYCPDMNNS